MLTPLLFISLQVKAAFTRTYNKEVHLTPYSLQVVKKGRRGGGGESELGGEEGENVVQESEEEEDGLQTDAMIKVRSSKCADQLNLCPLFFSLSAVSVPFTAEEDQSHQGVKERDEGRFWQG